MGKKLKLPILLLAVVLMLSIFYIKEAQDGAIKEPVDGGNVVVSPLNPEFTEGRLLSIEKANELINGYKEVIASGELSAKEVSDANALINEILDIKHNEIALEQAISTSLDYDDILVLVLDEYLVISVYTEEELSATNFISIARLAKSVFEDEYIVKVEVTNPLE